jgi:NAD(P)-dependent dehydrogenase (short-subunit alcohol dehydrogenase family)
LILCHGSQNKTLTFQLQGYNMPVSDISIPEAKSLFDLNVWSYIGVTQAFLPLLIWAASSSSRPSLIINNNSVSSVEPTPHNSVYHASKAASAMFSTHMRIELAPFNVRVVELKTGCVHSKFHANHQGGNASLPPTSIYQPVKTQTESAMRNAFPDREDPEKWARDVVQDIARHWDNPPKEIWRGTGAWRTWFANTFFPVGWWDQSWRKAVGLDLLENKSR